MRRYIDTGNLEKYLNNGKPRSSWPTYRSAREYARAGHGQGHDLARQLSILNKRIAAYYREYCNAKSITRQVKLFGKLKTLSKRACNIATKLHERGEINATELHAYLEAMRF